MSDEAHGGAAVGPRAGRARRHSSRAPSAPAADRRQAATEPTASAFERLTRIVSRRNLWFYRGDSPFHPGPIGHEFIGVVEDVGAEVQQIGKGDLVIASFMFCDNTCPHCRHGTTSACIDGAIYPTNGDGAQGEAVRVPLADGALVRVPGSGHSDETLASLLALSDVMSTGHHAAVCADVRPGGTVAVVGDGAVGLSGVLAAKRLGAGRIIALSRHPRPSGTGKAVRRHRHRRAARRRGHPGHHGAHRRCVDATLECVGTGQSFQTAIAIARPGAMVGYVGIPHGVELPIGEIIPPQQGRPRRLRAGARLHPRTAARGPHQPGPGARPRDRPGRHRRRLRRDGRAPGDQVPRARGDDLITHPDRRRAAPHRPAPRPQRPTSWCR